LTAWGFAPIPTGEAYSTLPDPLAGFKGDYFQGKGGEEGREGRAREGRGPTFKEEKGMGGLSPQT